MSWKIFFDGIVLGFLLALPAACCVPLGGVPHLSEPVIPGAEYICFGAALILCVALYVFGRPAGWKVALTSQAPANFIKVVLIAIPSGLIMIKPIFVVSFLLLVFLGRLF